MPGTIDPIIAVYAGSFDPVTHGHLDIIRRSADLFNKLIIGVGRNPQKEPLFSDEQRIAMIEPHLPTDAAVEIASYEGLTIDFARQCNARVLIRGIRNQADLSDELQQANLNRVIGHIETVFLLASANHMVTSSTYIRQIFELGGGDRDAIERLVPANVADALAKKLNR